MDPIQVIEQRNRRVEADKAWEISVTRRVCIAVVTYATASLFLFLIEVEQFYIHALVPTGGYLLSTLSFPFIKKLWMKRCFIPVGEYDEVTKDGENTVTNC
jgi:hypothetical protein